MSQTYDMTEGKVSKLILSFYFPMLFTNMLQQVYNIADTVIVGKGIGDDALAAVGNMSSLSFFIVGFSVGLTNGFSVTTAQNFGAKKYSELRKSVAASFILAVTVSLLLTVISVLNLKKVMTAMQTDESVLDDSLKYGYIIFGGLAATIAYNLLASILRALGDSKTPLTAIIISTTVNIILNSIFVFILKTGVEGPAAATIMSQIISAAVCYRRVRKIEILKLDAEDFKSCTGIFPVLLKNGLPMACMNSITAVGCMVIQYFVNGLGVVYMSAYSACSKYINLFMQPACTAGNAMSAYTSQNYGAGKYGRIWQGLKVCMAIAAVSYVVLGSAMVLIPRILAGFMLNGEEQIKLVMAYLPISGSFIFAVDFLFVFRSGVQGMGYPLVPMISGIVEMAMRVSVIIVFIGSTGFRATAWAEVAAWTGALVLNVSAFIIILKGKTERKKCYGKF